MPMVWRGGVGGGGGGVELGVGGLGWVGGGGVGGGGVGGGGGGHSQNAAISYFQPSIQAGLHNNFFFIMACH